MRTRDIRRYDMFVRVRAFGADHSDIFQGTTLGAKMLAKLEGAITELSRDFASQVSGHGVVREGSRSRAEARAMLRLNLDVISRTARLLARETTGLDGRFRLARSSSDQALLAAARAFAQDAQPLADAFLAHGLAENVLKDLPAQIQAVEEAISEQTSGKGSSVAAQAAIHAALRSGLTAVEELDSIVRNRLRHDTVTLAVWRAARRVGPHVNGEAVVAPAPTPAPTPPTPVSEGKAA